MRGRILESPHTFNVRDLGGLRTTDGGQTRRGMVYRGENITGLNSADVDVLLRSWPLATVVDLRTGPELRAAPSVFATTNLPVLHRSLRADEADLVPHDASRYGSVYRHYLEAGPTNVVAAVRTVTDVDRAPTLFFCAAGKDRTGVLAALVLDAVGVAHDEIASDYALSELGLDAVFSRLATSDFYRSTLADRRPSSTRLDPATILGFLAWLADTHGGAAHFLTSAGLEPDHLDRFRSAFVAPPD